MTSEPHASALTPQERADQRLRERYAAQRMLWTQSSIERVRHCGRHTTGGDVQLRVSATPDGARAAGFAGLQTCASVWACPVCSAKVLARRQDEISRAVDQWISDGGRVAMFTFTMKHARRDLLTVLWDALSSGWSAVTSGGAYAAEKVALGVATTRVVASGKRAGMTVPTSVLPWLRLVEVTHGNHGWHVHVHSLVFLPGDTTDDERDDLYAAWWRRWRAGLSASGVDGSLQVNHAAWLTGKDVSTKVGAYFTKNTYSAGQVAGLEAARSDLKSGRFGNRSAFEVLRDLIAQPAGPDAARRDAAIWAEYESASSGRRQMTWARGARDLFDLDVEQTDEELAAEELGSALDTIAEMSPAEWSRIIAVPGRRFELIRCARHSDAAARAQLDGWGILWSMPDGRRQHRAVKKG